jgi:hypothetical protein
MVAGLALPATAFSHHTDRIPTKLTTIERTMPDLYNRRPANWNRLRKMAASRYVRKHPAYYSSSVYLNDVLRYHGLHAMVYASYIQAGIPPWVQDVGDCIIDNESQWRPWVFFGGHDYPIVDDSVAGLHQWKPKWGPLSERLDAVWSAMRFARYWNDTHNFNPWLAQEGVCF